MSTTTGASPDEDRPERGIELALLAGPIRKESHGDHRILFARLGAPQGEDEEPQRRSSSRLDAKAEGARRLTELRSAMFKNPIRLVLASATALLLAVACGSSPTATMDAGPDEDALLDSGHATDARGTLDHSAADSPMDGTCVVMTCNGKSVTIPPGQTISYGDVCGDTCKFDVHGMFGLCGCSVQPGCACM